MPLLPLPGPLEAGVGHGRDELATYHTRAHPFLSSQSTDVPSFVHLRSEHLRYFWGLFGHCDNAVLNTPLYQG